MTLGKVDVQWQVSGLEVLLRTSGVPRVEVGGLQVEGRVQRNSIEVGTHKNTK